MSNKMDFSKGEKTVRKEREKELYIKLKVY